MSNKHEEIIKNKINNYMEQIKVPENLGGIIMEDFEKIKNEQEQNQESKQEKRVNEKPKNKKVLKISIASVAAVVLVGVGIFAGTKLVGEKIITINNNGAQNSNMASNNNSETKTDITKEESEKLLKFLNNSSNNPFTQLNFESPEKLFETIDNSDSYSLRYAVFNTKDNKYCSGLTTTQKSQLKTTKYGSSIDEVPWYFISEENLIKFLEEKMNYTYSKDILRKAFIYEEKVSGYIDCVSDTNYLEVSLQDGGYKLGNKYYLTLKNSVSEIEIVLLEENNSYYFYSSKVTPKKQESSKTENTNKDDKEKTESQTKTSISNQDLTKLTNFLQDSTNYPFLGINYDNPQDLFKATGNEAAKNTISHILGYSYFCSNYSKTATKEQIKIWYGEDVNEDYLNGSQEVISEEDLIKFFKEKMNVEYPKETLREVFRYSDKLNGYFVSRSDAFAGKVTIKNGYKLDNKYYLTLSRFTWDGKDIDVVISEENGSYYFYSCTNDYEINQAIVQDLYEQKLEKYVKSSNSKEKISEYFVDLVNVVEKPEGLGYENTNGIFATVRYSVKPVSKENNWIAGNGKIEDDGWIREKSACVIVEKQGDKYVITSDGTGW